MSVSIFTSEEFSMNTKDVYPEDRSSGYRRSHSKTQEKRKKNLGERVHLRGNRKELSRQARIHHLKQAHRTLLLTKWKITHGSEVCSTLEISCSLDLQKRTSRPAQFTDPVDKKLPSIPGQRSLGRGAGCSKSNLVAAVTLIAILGCADAATLPDGHYSPSNSRGLTEEGLGVIARRSNQQLINLNSLQLPALHRAGGGKGNGKGSPNSIPVDPNRAQNDNAYGSSTGPRFDMTIPRNLTVQEGQTAILSCRVLNLAEKTVSWIRLHNLHVLTVDKYKYSTDPRISVVHNEASQEWVLRIRAAEMSDAGQYECQISTKPVLSYTVSVQVIVPRAEILNAPDIYVHQGSLINLTCVVHHGTNRPVFVYWYHGDKLMEYEGDREGVTVITEAKTNTVSHLLVRNATLTDTGHYTCKPSNGNKASINLHVLQGEYQAAMQTNGARSPMCPSSSNVFYLILIHVQLTMLFKVLQPTL